jgi:hypothetical protein
MLRAVGIGLQVPISVLFALNVFWFIALFPHSTLAEEKVPLGKFAEMVIHKGFKDVSLGQLCFRFDLREATGGTCGAYNVGADDDDLKKMGNYREGWAPGFFALVDKTTGAICVVLVTQSKTDGYAFLTDVDGKLRMVATGRKVPGNWQWRLIDVSQEVRSLFSKERSVWVDGTYLYGEMEKLPDRKE